MSNVFNKRVFGSIILKSVNSNFNADFTHHPRTLPDGVVYSTDKALKYAIKDYFKNHFKDDKIFYIKRYNDKLNPLTLDETYEILFGQHKGKKGEDLKIELLNNLLECLDIRLFGATYAGKTNISIHGPLQINHGVNKYPENEIYTEDILSPFRNPGEKGSDEKEMSTIGNQTNLLEGHYVFHFSINPFNTEEFYKLINKDGKNNNLSLNDIEKLKEAMNNAVTRLDSSRKIGTENEASVWIELREGSRKMIPNTTELINVYKDSGKIIIDAAKVEENMNYIKEDVEKVEVYYNHKLVTFKGLEKSNLIKHFNIFNNEEL